MSFTKAMKDAGYEPKASTAGDKVVYNGVYKLMLTEFKNEPDSKWDDGQPKPQVVAGFKVTERLAGTDIFKSEYPDVKGYYSTADDMASNRKKGIAKLIDGFMSVGINVNGADDDATLENIKQCGKSFVVDNAPEGWEGECFSWFYENNQGAVESRDDQGGYPSDDEMKACLAALGYLAKEEE